MASASAQNGPTNNGDGRPRKVALITGITGQVRKNVWNFDNISVFGNLVLFNVFFSGWLLLSGIATQQRIRGKNDVFTVSYSFIHT